MIHSPCHHEQKIGEPVQIFDHCWIHFHLFRQTDNFSLGSAAYGPSYMQQSAAISTTGENELIPALPTEKFEVQLQGDDVLVDLG